MKHLNFNGVLSYFPDGFTVRQLRRLEVYLIHHNYRLYYKETDENAGWAIIEYPPTTIRKKYIYDGTLEENRKYNNDDQQLFEIFELIGFKL